VRRAALIAGALLLAAALALGLCADGRGAAGAASPTRHVRLILQWAPQTQFAGYYMALEKGFYRQQGLDVEIVPGGPAIDSIAYLKSGKADFATAFLTGAITAAAEGTPVVDVGQVVNRSNLMIVARRDVVKDRDGLDGRRVSLWGASFRSAYLGYFETARIKPVILPQYYSVNLFLLGGADACAAMEYNEYHTILQSGVDPGELTTFFMRNVGFDFPEDGIYALAETARSRPALCKAFADASLQGWEYCREHPDEATESVMTHAAAAHVPTNRVHQRWMLDHILASIFPEADGAWRPGVLARDDYERTRAVMIGEGLIDGAPSYERFVAKGARSAP
jgi:NitT/TauT family transport system substrate-binding protein